MSMSSKKMVTLKSSDGEIFLVEEQLAVQLQTINNCADKIIPIRNVSSKTLSKVIEFCRRKHYESTLLPRWLFEKEIKAWEYEFLQVDKTTLHDLDKAAVVLGIESLMDLTFQALKKDMTTEIAAQEIRKKIQIEKYCTKEEEEERRITYNVSKEIELVKKLGEESTKEEESESWKKTHIVNDSPKEIDFSIPKDPPKERDFGKESTEYTKPEESEYSITSHGIQKMVILKSSGGEIFVVEEPVAVQSQTIKNAIKKDDCADKIIPIRSVSGKTLSKVIEFCRRKHFESTLLPRWLFEKEIKAWEYEFLQVDKSTLRDLDKAAATLGIKSLMDSTFQTLKKDMTTGIAAQEICKKTRTEEEEELCKIYCIPNDPPKEIELSKKFGEESTKEEESESGKQYSMQHWLDHHPKEIDFLKNLGKESPEYTKEEEIELRKQCIIRQWFEPPKEIDFLKNLGKESPEYTPKRKRANCGSNTEAGMTTTER